MFEFIHAASFYVLFPIALYCTVKIIRFFSYHKAYTYGRWTNRTVTTTTDDSGTSTSYETEYEYYVDGLMYTAVAKSGSTHPDSMRVWYKPNKPHKYRLERENEDLMGGYYLVGVITLIGGFCGSQYQGCGFVAGVIDYIKIGCIIYVPLVAMLGAFLYTHLVKDKNKG